MLKQRISHLLTYMVFSLIKNRVFCDVTPKFGIRKTRPIEIMDTGDIHCTSISEFLTFDNMTRLVSISSMNEYKKNSRNNSPGDSKIYMMPNI
jgi:hypothetical protein